MNILVLGSSGFLGKKIFRTIKSISNLSAFHNGLVKKKYDLTQITQLKKIIKHSNPDLIINASAISDIDECEQNKKKTYKINVDVVKNIFKIKKKKKLNFFFIQFSTDQLYDSKKTLANKETSNIKINNEYARQKAKLEIICKKNKCLILRTNFFGKSKNKKNLTNWIFYSFKKRKKINLFKDIYFSPLRIDTLCKIIKYIIINKKYNYRGVFNLGSKKFISKSNFAIFFAKKTKIYNKNYSLVKVNSILKVKRSRNMIMNSTKFEKTFKIMLPKIKHEIMNEAKNYLK